MNIWVIGRSYPTDKNKMRGSFELEQVTMLAKRGHSVVYIACVFHPINKVKKWGYTSWQENGLSVCVYSQFYAPDRIKLHWKALQEKRWRQLLKYAEETGGLPDVIHIHYPGMITEPVVINEYQKRGTMIVVTDHWTRTLVNDLDNHQRNQLCWYAREADEFICVGEPLKQAVKAITGVEREISVIPNVVSDIFKPGRTVSSNKTYRFIAVGRLAPVKQFDGIIKAFSMKFKGNEDVKLTIIGGGKLMPDLKKLSLELGVSQQVEFTGTLSREDVAKRVATADCLICFSRLETFGVPVIEAWACGIPAIGTDCLGFLEYYNDSFGYIVSHDSVDELAEAMERVAVNRESYSKEYISIFAKENFGEDAVYKKLMKIYTS
ncbi:MAG: glycosyltransferase [Clostridiales bacterium]|nr:glycosyltransferase [Clostridiales bacterium]